jgi:hypothetical protein
LEGLVAFDATDDSTEAKLADRQFQELVAFEMTDDLMEVMAVDRDI